MIDILEALAAEAPAKSTRKCKVQRWLDDIAEDAPGKTALVAAIVTTDPKSDDYRTVDQVDKIVYRLGLMTSTKTLGDHRAKRCRCFV
jgi:hypothetical protein